MKQVSSCHQKRRQCQGCAHKTCKGKDFIARQHHGINQHKRYAPKDSQPYLITAAKDRPVQTYNQSLSFKLFIHESADRLRNGRQGLHEIFGHHREQRHGSCSLDSCGKNLGQGILCENSKQAAQYKSHHMVFRKNTNLVF